MPKPRNNRRRSRKRCYFTENKVNYIDYKDYQLLLRFISDRGKILPRRVTGTKAYFQKHLAKAIKRARFMALLPYVKE
ncbi:MAG: 30S ribosomal protein S18 [Tenericutes bacterium]|nr:30S ribosomal protein S18 [Mycoplasmatota bacterium]